MIKHIQELRENGPPLLGEEQPTFLRKFMALFRRLPGQTCSSGFTKHALRERREQRIGACIHFIGMFPGLGRSCTDGRSHGVIMASERPTCVLQALSHCY